MRDIITTIQTLVDATTPQLGDIVETIGTRDHVSSDARFLLSISSLTGTSPTADVYILANRGGVDFIIGTFTQKTAADQESIVIAACPAAVRGYVVLGGTVTDLDLVLTCIRL